MVVGAEDGLGLDVVRVSRAGKARDAVELGMLAWYVFIGWKRGHTVSLKMPCSPHDGTAVLRVRVAVVVAESAGAAICFLNLASPGPGM